MEIPHLVRERLGDESVEATVNLGDEDVVCVTPTRTLVYRSEGLLSDESVSIFAHDVEQFDISEGRRKTKFLFEYVDETDSFTVPANRAETILKLLVGGILHVADVTDDGESISDVFTFSELTLVVTSDRLVKHVGAPVWDEDYEVFPYADVSGLSFEEGSVATQVVITVDGRPQRIKAPSEEARKVERSLKQALFAYYDVETLAALNEKVGDAETAGTRADDSGGSAGSLSLDDGISPLVGGDDEDSPTAGTSSAGGRSAGGGTNAGSASRSQPGGSDAGSEGDSATRSPESGTTKQSSEPSVDTISTPPTPQAEAGDEVDAVDPEDIEAMKQQISTLTKAVKKQNNLLRDQQETIDQLIEELRRGR